MQVGVIGEKADLGYAYHHVGAGPDALAQYFTHQPIAKERPMFIVGMGALARPDGAAILSMAAKAAMSLGVVKDGWNGFNILHTAASRVAGLDLGESWRAITASSGIDEREIERMVHEAETHGAEDKERRKKVEQRNNLDGLVYNTDKTYSEHKEKLSPEEKGELEEAIAAARKALEGEDSAAMEAASERLTKASHKLAEAMYKQQAASGAPNAGSDGAAPGAKATSDDVIDAEYVEADKK